MDRERGKRIRGCGLSNFKSYERMSLTAEQIKSLFPNASASLLKRNSETSVRPVERAVDAVRKETGPVVEPDRGNEPVGPVPGTGRDTGQHLVCYEIRRNRLIRDPENVCTKAFTDALRYAGLIPEDSFDALKIEWSQTQVPKEKEGTVITIFPPGTW